MDKSLDYTERRGKRFVWLLACVFTLVFALFFIYQMFVVPLILGFVFSFAVLPAVDWCEKRKINRGKASFMILSFSLLVLTGILVLLAPVIYKQFINLVSLSLTGLKDLESIWIPRLKIFLANQKWFPVRRINEFFSDFNMLSEIAQRGEGTLNAIFNQSSLIFEAAMTMVMMPVFSFFVLRDFYTIQEKVVNVVPLDLREPWLAMLAKINAVLREVLKGQIIVAFVLAILYATGFSIIGISSGLVIGLIAGICRVIPYLDIFVAGFLCIFSILTDFGWHGQIISVGIVIILVQAIDGMFITPRVVGKRAGLHPLLVIASVMAFGSLFGFLGVLLAIPIIATIKVMIQFFMPYYYHSHYYKPRK